MMDFPLILLLVLAALRDEVPAGTQGKPLDSAQGKSSTTAVPVQDVERPLISAAEIKALRDSNIFAPRNKKRVYVPPTRPGGGKSEPAVPAKPKPPVVTGIFYDAKAEAFLVVVEDRNDAALKQFKEPKFLKSGDEVNGFKIGLVTAERAVFLKGEITKELKVGESMPGPDGKSVTVVSAPEDPEAAPAPEGEEKSEKVEIKPLDPETHIKAMENLKKKAGKKNRPSQDE
jgi:hypothetical protein